ncbi:MAG: glycosyl hydrolase-related protein [Planctomycetota bacterium]|jgi:hypothetical protein
MIRANTRFRPVLRPGTLLVAAAWGAWLGADESPAAEQPAVEQVVVVFKTHFDVGYTDLARNVVSRYRTSMIDKALDVCDHTKELRPEHRFVWTLPGWPMQQVLWPGQTAQRRGRIDEAIREGRLVWHALPGSLHTESLELEDLVRGFRFSSGLSRSFDVPPARDAKMTDVPSHVWALPTVLKHAGIDFLHLGCNSASASPEVPLLFWWEGPDGSRLLTMYEASGYGSRLRPPEGWRHKTWLALIHTGDNHGPPAPGEVRKLLDRAGKELPSANVRMGRLSDFADAVLAENPQLPVVRADMPDTWIHGIMSMPQETKTARNVRPRIAALEALNTLLWAWGADVPPAAETVAKAYEGSLMYGEHTWGYSVPLDERLYGQAWRKARAERKYDRLEESWREHGGYIRGADRTVAPALDDNMAALARDVGVDGPRIVVFNPLPWKRDDVIALDAPDRFGAVLQDAATGRPAPTERAGPRLRFLARELPPLGYRTYVPGEQEAGDRQGLVASEDPLLENRHFRLELDPKRGVIASWIDKRGNRELVEAASSYGFGQYLYERFDADVNQAYFESYCKYIPGWVGHFARFDMPPADEVPYAAVSPKAFTLEARRGSVSETLVMTSAADAQMPHAVSLAVTLYAEEPYVDLEWTITDKPPDTWPEAGWLCLPLAVREPRFHLGRLGAPVDPAGDTVRGANHEVFCLNGGMTVTDPEGRGVGLCSADAPLVSLGRPGVYRYSKELGSREPVVFVNLFNNVWGTNFQQWIGGSWSARARLWVPDDGGTEADLITPSWETRNRAIAVVGDGPGGSLPPAQSGVELSRRGVLVTALGPNPDGPGLLLRLWEQAGRAGGCRVKLPAGLEVARARPCDLRGRPRGEPVPVREGHLSVSLSPFAPASFLLEVAAPEASGVSIGH